MQKSSGEKGITIPEYGVWLQSTGNDVIKAVTSSPINWLIADMQHGFWTLEDIENLCLKCGVFSINSIKPLVRVGLQPTASEIGSVLDSGAWGIIIPNVETVEEVRLINNWMRYPPLGTRSVARCSGLDNTGLSLVDYIKWSNENISLISMIESKKGMENLEAIAKVSDGILFGVRDLSLSYQSSIECILNDIEDQIKRYPFLTNKLFGIAGIDDIEINKTLNCTLYNIGTIRNLIKGSIVNLVNS